MQMPCPSCGVGLTGADTLPCRLEPGYQCGVELLADLRIVPCETCGTEGRILTQGTGYSREYGYYPEDIDHGPCPCCDGTGGEIIRVEPIDLADLDAIHSDSE